MKHTDFTQSWYEIVLYFTGPNCFIDRIEVNSDLTQSLFLSNIKIVHNNACDLKSK